MNNKKQLVIKGKEIPDKIFPNEETYSIDVYEELTSMLSEELARNIDAEIIKNIMAMGLPSRADKIKSILKRINTES